MDNSYKYKAFISYRHIEPDKTIASKLQKKLESFKPPKSVMEKKSGTWRIFRDETELNSGSSLSDNITEALDNSEFLIIVCSESTKDSKWCMQELNHFKKLHNGSNKKIITVVASGEPNEVFPEALYTEITEIPDKNGAIIREARKVEPLAANVSGKTNKEASKKLKNEFLRIAAPLMGCDYDDLYKRQQKKKNKQKLFLIALLFAFCVYSGSMLFKINMQNEKLTEKNAEILTNQSKLFLEDLALTDAALSAKEAIKMQLDSKLPINPEAQRILGDATGAYTSKAFTIKDKITLSGNAVKIKIIPKTDYIVSYDAENFLYLINITDKRTVKTKAFENPIYDIKVTEDTIYVVTPLNLTALDSKTLDLKWEYVPQNQSGIKDIILNLSGIVVMTTSETLYFLTSDGIVSDEINFNKPEDSYLNHKTAVFENEYLYTEENSNDEKNPILHKINITTKQAEKSIALQSEGDIVYLYSNNEYLFANVASENEGTVYCLRKNDLSVKWSCKIEKAGVIFSPNSYNDIKECTIDEKQYITVFTQNGYFMLDYESGKIESSKRMSGDSHILSYMYTTPVGINVMTSKGWEPCLLDESLSLNKNFHNGDFTTKGTYLVTENRETFIFSGNSADIILYYDIKNEDVSYEEIIKEEDNYTDLNKYDDNGKGLFLTTGKVSNENYSFKINVYDFKTKTSVSSINLSSEALTITAKFFDSDKILISDGYYLNLYDLKGNLLSSLDLRELAKSNGYNGVSFNTDIEIIKNYIVCGGSDCHIIAKSEKNKLKYADIVCAASVCTNKSGDYVFAVKTPENSFAFAYSGSHNKPEYITINKNRFETTEKNIKIQISKTGKFIGILTGDNAFYLYNTKTKKMQEKLFTPTDKIPSVFAISPDEKYIMSIGTDNIAIKYQTDDINKISLSEKAITKAIVNKINFIEKNDIYIKADAFNSAVFDCKNMVIKANLNINSDYFVTSENVAINYDSANKSIQALKYLTVNELLNIADKFITTHSKK